MEISKKTDYAIRMLAELVRGDGDIVSVRLAAEKNDVPYSFARSIQHDLVRSGIVESIRGSHGGMRLAIDPAATTIRMIVEAIQGPIHVSGCEEDADGAMCSQKNRCNFNALWCEADRMLRDYFDSVTLYQVVVEGRCPTLRGGHDFVPLTPDERRELARS